MQKNMFPEPNEAIVEKLLEKGICCKSMLDERVIALERFTETSYSNEELVLVLLLTVSAIVSVYIVMKKT